MTFSDVPSKYLNVFWFKLMFQVIFRFLEWQSFRFVVDIFISRHTETLHILLKLYFLYSFSETLLSKPLFLKKVSAVFV